MDDMNYVGGKWWQEIARRLLHQQSVNESGTTPKNRRPNRERMRRALAGLNRMVWVSSQGLGMSQVSICS